MKKKLVKIYKTIEPFKDIIWFLFLFVSLDFLWKLCVNVGEDGISLFVLGKDMTESVQPISLWTAKVSHWIIHSLLGYDDFKIDGTLIYFDHLVHHKDLVLNSLKLRVVWECTGVQQIILFSLIILFYYGPINKKLWFIPLSIVILNLINVLRIVGTALLIKDGFPDWFIPFNEWYNKTEWSHNIETFWNFYLDWFQLFHKDVFRWLYYNGVIFILWLIWQEKYNLPYQKLKLEKEKSKK